MTGSMKVPYSVGEEAADTLLPEESAVDVTVPAEVGESWVIEDCDRELRLRHVHERQRAIAASQSAGDEQSLIESVRF